MLYYTFTILFDCLHYRWYYILLDTVLIISIGTGHKNKTSHERWFLKEKTVTAITTRETVESML